MQRLVFCSIIKVSVCEKSAYYTGGLNREVVLIGGTTVFGCYHICNTTNISILYQALGYNFLESVNSQFTFIEINVHVCINGFCYNM